MTIFHSCSMWLLGPFEARKGFFFSPPLLSIHTGEDKSPKLTPRASLQSLEPSQGTGNVDNGQQSSGLGVSAGNWRGKELELVGRMFGNFIPCHFRHGSVIVLYDL